MHVIRSLGARRPRFYLPFALTIEYKEAEELPNVNTGEARGLFNKVKWARDTRSTVWNAVCNKNPKLRRQRASLQVRHVSLHVDL